MTAARSPVAHKNRLLTPLLAFVSHHSKSGCKKIKEKEYFLNPGEIYYFKTPTQVLLKIMYASMLDSQNLGFLQITATK